MNINLEKTAICNGVASSVKSFSPLFLEKGQILDYGAGRLRNSKYLMQQGYDVSIMDTDKQLHNISDNDRLLFKNIYSINESFNNVFDGIISNFVLNVIPEINIREEIINNMFKWLKPDGIGIIEVRGAKGILLNKYLQPYKDGYLVGNGKVKTFQKPYKLEELINIFEKKKFKILNSISFNDSHSVVVRRNS